MTKNRFISRFLAPHNSTSVRIPGSKSYTNRALMIASIANGESHITNLPKCDDVTYFLKALENIGINIEKQNDSAAIKGNNGSFPAVKNNQLFCGIAGTTSRFLTALTCLIPGNTTISGEGKLLTRPIGDLVDALRSLGVKIEYLNNSGSIPLSIHSDGDFASNISINGSISSQFLSAILMIAPRLKCGLEISVTSPLVSKSYVDLTIDTMANFAAQVDNDGYRKFTIKSQEYRAQQYKVEGDWSSASYFLAFSILNKQPIELYGLNPNSLQGDRWLIKVCEELGAKINATTSSIKIEFYEDFVNPITINMENMPDSAMTIACVCAFANGVSCITGLSTLKTKETDRLTALHNELRKVGIRTEISDDTITIYGNPDLNLSTNTHISTYHDHRMAMCFAILGTKLGNITIENCDVVTKSLPEFWDMLEKIGVKTVIC